MQRILVQFDTDAHPSSFDRVVAVDAGVDHLFSYGGVRTADAVPLVHGAIFTRGPQDLKHTAIFIGGSNVAAGEELLNCVRSAFFGPLRVSVMMDSNGSNTTAAAAVLCARKHLPLAGASALVLGGTGPVGRRVAQLLAAEKAEVCVASRALEKADEVCRAVVEAVPGARLRSLAPKPGAALAEAVAGANLVVAAGAAGVELLPAEMWRACDRLRVAIDLNAVPPAGIGGISATDKAAARDGAVCYGAIGVGGLKMKIHKAALSRLFESNDQVFDTAAIYRIGESLI